MVVWLLKGGERERERESRSHFGSSHFGSSHLAQEWLKPLAQGSGGSNRVPGHLVRHWCYETEADRVLSYTQGIFAFASHRG